MNAADLYIYGGMDIEELHVTTITRENVSLHSKIKEGHFADIIKATATVGKGQDNVVAKVLKGWLKEVCHLYSVHV